MQRDWFENSGTTSLLRAWTSRLPLARYTVSSVPMERENHHDPMLATLLRPDSGTARVFGHDVVSEGDAVRGRVSLTGQFASVDEDLTGFENLVLIARLLGLSRKEAKMRADELLEAFGLAGAAGRQVKTYSGGMRRKLDIAASIVVTPDLIFLDEPTSGLDPRSRNQVWDIIRALAYEGTTVLLTTQYLDEADQLADRIVVIDNGKVIAEGTPGELKNSVGSGVLRVRLREPEARVEAERILSQTLGVAVETPSDPVALVARVSEPDRVSQASRSCPAPASPLQTSPSDSRASTKCSSP